MDKVPITIALEITSVTPKHTSLAGGRTVTINGFGFASDTRTPVKMLNNDLRIEVFAGLSRCHIEKVTKTAVECQTGHHVIEKEITSTGGNFPNVTVKAGEAVRWQWAFLVNGKAPRTGFEIALLHSSK